MAVLPAKTDLPCASWFHSAKPNDDASGNLAPLTKRDLGRLPVFAVLRSFAEYNEIKSQILARKYTNGIWALVTCIRFTMVMEALKDQRGYGS